MAQSKLEKPKDRLIPEFKNILIRHLKYEDIKVSAVVDHRFKTKHTKNVDKTEALEKLPYYFPGLGKRLRL